MTIEELREQLRVWQGRLRLQDWDIRLTLVRADEIPGVGEVGVADTLRQAEIKLLRTEDLEWRTSQSVCPEVMGDQEITLVHELLHVQFNDLAPKGFTTGSPERIAIERAIDATAIALVTLARGPA